MNRVICQAGVTESYVLVHYFTVYKNVWLSILYWVWNK